MLAQKFGAEIRNSRKEEKEKEEKNSPQSCSNFCAPPFWGWQGCSSESGLPQLKGAPL